MNYEGKKLTECPDGTVAVVKDKTGYHSVRQYIGGKVTDYGDGDPVTISCEFTVIQILKLGKPRPETFADEEPGVAWRDVCDTLYWRGDDNELMYCDLGSHPVHAGCGAGGFKIPDTYTRAGRVRVVLDPLPE